MACSVCFKVCVKLNCLTLNNETTSPTVSAEVTTWDWLITLHGLFFNLKSWCSSKMSLNVLELMTGTMILLVSFKWSHLLNVSGKTLHVGPASFNEAAIVKTNTRVGVGNFFRDGWVTGTTHIFVWPNLYLCLQTMSHPIYAAKFEQTTIHQHVHLQRESQSHAPTHVLMRL